MPTHTTPVPPVGHEQHVVRAPDGAFVRVRPEATTDQVAAAFAERAMARLPQPARITTRGEAPQIFGPVLDAVTNLLHRTTTSSLPEHRHLVLHAMHDLADEDTADADLTAGRAVLRIHRELDVLWVHPLSDPVDPAGIRASDLRGRRLAATAAADQLADAWRHPGPERLTDLPAGAALLAAARALDESLRWLHGTPRAGVATALRIEMTPLRVSEHPVLRVPPTQPLPTSRVDVSP